MGCRAGAREPERADEGRGGAITQSGEAHRKTVREINWKRVKEYREGGYRGGRVEGHGYSL